MEKLKKYSISHNLLSEKFTNWDLLFDKTKQIIRTYLIKATEWHNFDYLSDEEPFERLPSDCYSDMVHIVISLWFPFYYDLVRSSQEVIDIDIQQILFDMKKNQF